MVGGLAIPDGDWEYFMDLIKIVKGKIINLDKVLKGIDNEFLDSFNLIFLNILR
jgi:hypothetical protein